MIKVLSQHLVNQIAAGEVIDRPASVIKELVENAIDAGATKIQVQIANAGKSLIQVTDNGCGMDKDSLELSILSHATSKLTDDNLFEIHTFGFRGEALPSMTSIARVSITSSTDNSNEAWKISIQEKNVVQTTPTTGKKGTTVEVRDLFFATPARLKFLKSDSSENDACIKTFNNIALAFHKISLSFKDGNRKEITYQATNDIRQRIIDVFGEIFIENTFFVDVCYENLSLKGFLGVPTFNKSSSNRQYFFVNNRFVKDKIFSTALNVSYMGLTPHGRYPIAVLFLSLPYEEVDVNAHPAKTEIRFKEPEKIRRFLISELKKSLQSYGSAIPTNTMVDKVFENKSNSVEKNNSPNFNEKVHKAPQAFNAFDSHRVNKNFAASIYQPHKAGSHLNDSSPRFTNYSIEKSSDLKLPYNTRQHLGQIDLPTHKEINENHIYLGRALCQIANTYIIASTDDSLIVVDQHAAAERITLEKLKKDSKLEPQSLLLPEMCPFSHAQIELIENHKELINKFGIIYEKLTDDLIMVQALPAILGACEAKPLMNDIAEELSSFGNITSLQEKINLLMSTISCHGSLRAGKKLSIEEMNVLLRSMERTPNIAQCCHGRPSYVLMNAKILNKLFERS
ncbi:MAG: DNA mismatch repair endonuclease MutL [Alphaproteobacteria bacterium]|nr:DNA mismatch repair endonuclease MutL [Alphaproteobacteria bacterium]